MAALTDQIRRFVALRAQDVPAPRVQSGPPAPGLSLNRTLGSLHTQILSLLVISSVKRYEALCRKAADSLEDELLAGDVDVLAVGELFLLQNSSRTGSPRSRIRMSELLGALAAWKWIDLHDELRKPRLLADTVNGVDILLSLVGALVFQAMHSLSGELEGVANRAREGFDSDRKRRASQIGHEGKRRLHERTRQKLVEYALGLRATKSNRSDAVRATLRRFYLEPGVPRPRTLHGWLKAEGWTRDTPRAD